MDFFHHLRFDLRYLGHPTWDSGIVPPEVQAFIQGNPAGRALDLGCGTGTSSVALAHAGWDVTGVDFVRRAIRIAKQIKRADNLSINFMVADVTHLPAFLLNYRYDLVLDIGCFHGLSPKGKTGYLRQLECLLATGGTWLMYGFINEEAKSGLGLSPADLEGIPFWLKKRQDGVDPKGPPSAWFWFQKV
jgi:cyclopropane fatty-acyl-phospholipid synthase-like methyltransferase